MSLHAVEAIDDAIDATRAFLWPIDVGTWVRLALVTLFALGPGTNVTSIQVNAPTGGGTVPDGTVTPPDGVPAPALDEPFWLAVAGAVAAALLLGLLFLLVGSVMEFVLVESIRRESVSVREYWGRRWRQGVRLFAFRLAFALLLVGGAAAAVAVVVFPAAFGGGDGLAVAAVLLLFPVAAVAAVVLGLVHGFTTAFVVPVMVLEDCGVLAAWRRLWPAIAANPVEFLAYAVVGFLLSIAGGIVVGTVVAVAAVALLIPFGILGAMGVLLVGVAGPVGIAVVAVAVVTFVAAVVAAVAVVQVPVITYLRYYALFVLGDVDPDLDLIPERRAAVRGEPEPTG
ncbi:DUF7544 domain-containing protein [Halostella litorea]|uniref:DUF7544 domain-containing protein n=1 Tax=Halostella litorea TaxID=2528831 RepID=UPI0010924406|nr:hypothetical protein [Halostella litorea]